VMSETSLREALQKEARRARSSMGRMREELSV
jgi:hypothetical protein